jgi:hypothetical protein
MVYSITYRRPAHVSSSGASVHSEKSAVAESVTSRSSCSYGIPDALSFDKIIDGGTCPVSSNAVESPRHNGDVLVLQQRACSPCSIDKIFPLVPFIMVTLD